MGLFDRFKRKEEPKVEPVAAQQQYQDAITTIQAQDGLIGYEYYDPSFQQGKSYDKTRIFINPSPQYINGRPIYTMFLSYYGTQDMVMFDNPTGESARATEYKQVLAGLDLYALQNDPNYFKYAIKELLNQQRVERYLSVGLKTDREIRDINSAIFEGKEYNSPNAASIDEVAKDSELIRRGKKVYPCGRYVGEILPRDGHVGIVFDPSVGRICHDEPTIANDRQRLQDEKMRMKNAQMLEAQRKYERLQQEYRNMQSPINYQDQPNDDGR